MHSHPRVRQFHTLRHCLAAVNALVAMGAASAALAGATTWTGGAGNPLWSDPANWSGGVPTGADTAVFGPGASAPELDGQTRTVGTLLLNGPGERSLLGGLLRTDHILIAGNFSFPDLSILNANVAASGGTLRIAGSQRPQIHGLIGDGAGGGDFGVTGIADLYGTQTYTGPTIGTFDITGSIRNSPLVWLSGFCTIEEGNNGDVLSDSAELRLGQGRILFTTSFGQAHPAERIGEIVAAPGATDLFFSGASETPTNVVAKSFARAGGSLVNIGHYSAAIPSTLSLVDAPALVGPGDSRTRRGILKGVVAGQGGADSFVTYDAPGPNGVTLRALNRTTEYVNTIAPGDGRANVRTLTPQNVAAHSTINALLLESGGGTITLSNGSDLTIDSGMISFSRFLLSNGSAIRGDGRLVVPGEVILALGSDTPTIDVPIQANRATIAGGSYNHEINFLRPNTLPGGITVARARLNSGVQGAMGSGPVHLLDAALGVPSPQQIDGRLTVDSVGFENFLDVAATATLSVNGPISGNGTLLVSGGAVRFLGGGDAESLWLDARNLEIAGTFVARDASELHVEANNTLSGSGVVLGQLRAVRLAPGANSGAGSVGRIIADRYAVEGNLADLRFDLSGDSPGDEYDQLVALSSLQLSGGTQVIRDATLRITLGFSPAPGQLFTLIDNRFDGSFTGRFLNLPEGALLTSGGVGFLISYIGGDGNDIVLTVVPEPGGALCAVALLAALGGRRRGRWRRSG